MQDQDVSGVAAMMAALSQSTRLRIIHVVTAGDPAGTPAGEIARAVHCPASTLSFHLKELAQAGLLHKRQDGRYIHYQADFETMSGVIEYLTENCCQGQCCDIDGTACAAS